MEATPRKEPVKRRSRGLGRVFQPTYPNGRYGRDPEAPKYLRSRIWWVGYSYRGKRFEESSHSTTRMDAVRLLKRRLGEIGRGQLIGRDAEKVTFEDLAQMLKDDYLINERKSLDRAEDALERLSESFAGMRALDLNPEAFIRRRWRPRGLLPPFSMNSPSSSGPSPSLFVPDGFPTAPTSRPSRSTTPARASWRHRS